MIKEVGEKMMFDEFYRTIYNQLFLLFSQIVV